MSTLSISGIETGKWQNNKTGNIYRVFAECINISNGQLMIVYREVDVTIRGLPYVQEVNEFKEKFTKIND